MTTCNLIAPHTALQNATFCYGQHGDGATAMLIVGWEALCKAMNDEVACGEDETWGDVMSHIEDWEDDGNGIPFYWHTSFEDGSIRIYRVTTAT